ncbi:MAG: NnrS family protein [Verrucomicrobia bacterium]|nr:MAG: NnrS family protein [Verrucomicrobiota bacterium]
MHLVFVGGFGLVTLAVGTRVALGHAGQQALPLALVAVGGGTGDAGRHHPDECGFSAAAADFPSHLRRLDVDAGHRDLVSVAWQVGLAP